MTTMHSLRIGTRGSRLALWQANWVRDQILAKYPSLTVELVIIKTQGDKIQDRPLAEIGGKGLFIKELETAMIEQQTDLCVHSMKDVPAELPEGLEISIITARERPHDALIAPRAQSLDDLPKNAVVGTSSLRRASQLKAYRADLEIKSIRGNVDTRLKKVESGEFDASILAVAGLKRLGWEQQITQELPFSVMLPAIAQGVVGIETRSGDETTLSYLKHMEDIDTTDCIRAERTVLAALEGNCQIPIAGFCSVEQDLLTLTALTAKLDGSLVIRHQGSAPRQQAEELGQSIAQKILDDGGREILAELN
ncbi:MAG: hydroxymethylbilane synthase [SAR324 cluster bacterium]|nr:hydroxymethylbilane synthase [SAR324 cluster bacterium]